MGLALLVVIWLITLISSYYFAIDKWPLPAPAATHAAAIDHHYGFTLVAMGVVFLAAQLGLGLFVWRYRDRGPQTKVTYSHGNTKLEVLWTTLTAILFIGLNLAGTKIWAEARFQPASAQAVRVEVSGLQFAWYYRYPGPDGQFGKTRPELQNADEGNPVGLDESDPAAKDDIVVGSLTLPVDREAELILRSQDVIHSYFIPNMRFKQDAVPGLRISTHFTPSKVGDYEVACAELCGLGHYKMRSSLRVVTQEEFERWLAERQAAKQEQE